MSNGSDEFDSNIELPAKPVEFVKPEGFPGTETNCIIGGFGCMVTGLNPLGKCVARIAPHIVPGPKHAKIWVTLVGRSDSFTMLIV